MKDYLLRTFFPGLVIQRLEREAYETRIAALEQRIVQLENKHVRYVIHHEVTPVQQTYAYPTWTTTTGAGSSAGCQGGTIINGSFDFLKHDPDLYDDDAGAVVAQ